MKTHVALMICLMLCVLTGCAMLLPRGKYVDMARHQDGTLALIDADQGHGPYGTLRFDYGLMIWRSPWKNHGAVRYELFFKKEAKKFVTFDLQEFLHELNRIPKGAKLYKYNTCQISTFYVRQGEHVDFDWHTIEKACQERSITIMGRTEETHFGDWLICAHEG